MAQIKQKTQTELEAYRKEIQTKIRQVELEYAEKFASERKKLTDLEGEHRILKAEAAEALKRRTREIEVAT